MTQPQLPWGDGADRPVPARRAARRVVMVTSPGPESALADVATNLATVCAEIGQRVALVSTAGLASPPDGDDPRNSTTLWWKNWPFAGNGATSTEGERGSLLTGPLDPADVEDLLGDTGVPGVSRLDLRSFVGHPAQVVIRVPEVLAALRQIVDVIILEVPSYLAVHHGEGLTPLADAVVVVGELETTSVDEARKTSATLRRLGAPVVGVALTGAEAETNPWGVDLDLETDDEHVDEDPNPTEETLVAGSAGAVPPAPLQNGPVVDHEPQEA